VPLCIHLQQCSEKGKDETLLDTEITLCLHQRSNEKRTRPVIVVLIVAQESALCKRTPKLNFSYPA